MGITCDTVTVGSPLELYLGSPGDIVVADHDSFGRSRGAAGVDERTRLARSLRIDALLDRGVRDTVSELVNKVKPEETPT